MAEPPSAFEAPAPLRATHDLAEFRCGEPALDEWLRDRAAQNVELAASNTFVACPRGSTRVVGYYALAMGQVLNREAPGSVRRNMPRNIPAVILGRLAIDGGWQGKGLGQALLRDAVERSARAAAEVAARLLVVHAISPAAEAFYLHHGFFRMPVEPPTYGLDLARAGRRGAT